MAKKQQDTFFNFKARIEDFIVEEILDREPSGRGDYIYVFIEKKNLTTMDVVNSLMRQYKLNRKGVGIAGLKDKRGITRQWISILKKDLHKKGGEGGLIKFLEENMRVLKVTYNEKGLRLGKNKGNRFFLTLRNNGRANLEELKKETATILEDIKEKGMPNYYGAQKMGVTGQNPKLGYLLVSGKIKTLKYEKDSIVEKKFKVQAYVSEAFNNYLDARLEQCSLDTVLKGDVVLWKPTGTYLVLEKPEEFSPKNMVVTGPIAGEDLELPKHDSLHLEKKALNKSKIDINNLGVFKPFNLFGIRRPIVAQLKNMKYMFNKNNDLLLEFDLSSGSYATVLIDILERRLTQKLTRTKSNVKKGKFEKGGTRRKNATNASSSVGLSEKEVETGPKVRYNPDGTIRVKKRRKQMDEERKNKGKRHFKKKKNA